MPIESVVVAEQEQNQDIEDDGAQRDAEQMDDAYEVTEFEGDEFQFTTVQAARRHDMHSATGRNPYATTRPTTEDDDVEMQENEEQAPDPEGVIVAMVTESPSISSWDYNSDQERASSDSSERLHYAPPLSEVPPTPTPIADYVDFIDRIEHGDPSHGNSRQPCTAFALGDDMKQPNGQLRYTNWKIRNYQDGGVPGFHGFYSGSPYYTGEQSFSVTCDDESPAMQSALLGGTFIIGLDPQRGLHFCGKKCDKDENGKPTWCKGHPLVHPFKTKDGPIPWERLSKEFMENNPVTEIRYKCTECSYGTCKPVLSKHNPCPWCELNCKPTGHDE